MASTKYPDIEVELTGNDGNAFSVMGSVSRALRAHGIDQSEVETYRREAMSGDYDALLQTTMQWVSIS